MPQFMEIVTNVRNVALLVTALAGAVGTFFGLQTYLDTTYASTESVVKLEKRLSLQELKDLQKEALEELYFWRKQGRKNPNDLEVKTRLIEAEEYVEDIKKQIREIK